VSGGLGESPSLIVGSRPREAKPFTRLRGFELCECREPVIVERLTGDPMTFLRAIPCPAVSARRRFFQRRWERWRRRMLNVPTAFLFDEDNRRRSGARG
jgi:hypothetical protein